jgi:FdhE protein
MSAPPQALGAWVEAHPYLADLARLHEGVESAERAPQARRDPRSPGEVAAGVPLLKSTSLDPAVFDEAGKLMAAMAETLLEAELPPALLDDCRTLCVLLGENPRAGARLARAAARGEAPAPAGLGAFLAWKALGRVAGSSEGSEGWTGNCCPTCGALPAMGWLRQTERGRERALVCGLCGTRWSYARIGCPFCRNEALERLGVLEPEDEGGFRIDVCRQCNAYLKTYVGEGPETLALSDWSTLHLDGACAERGLQRGGPSLYAL